MFRSVFFLFALLLLSARAGQLPLNVSEIGLMLRSGYSSNSLMHELSTRHFADTIDEAKEKTLVKAGASAELIAALNSGIYSLTPEKTAVVQEQMAAAEQRRAEQAEASRKSDAAYQRKSRASERPSRLPNLIPARMRFLNFSKAILCNGATASSFMPMTPLWRTRN